MWYESTTQGEEKPKKIRSNEDGGVRQLEEDLEKLFKMINSLTSRNFDWIKTPLVLINLKF